MKPIKITTYTKRIAFQTHHPAHRYCPRYQTGHDKVIGKVVGHVVGGSHRKIRGQRYQHNLQWLNFLRIQQLVAEAVMDISPKNLPDSSIVMSMFNDIEFNRAGNEQMCINSAQQVAEFSIDFKPGRCRHIEPRSEQSWTYDTIEDTRGKWDAIAEKMTDIFAQSGHPVFPALEKMKKGSLKSKSGTTTIHFTADNENVQMLMKLTLSCNQLCMFRSVANILDDQPERSHAETERDVNVSYMDTSHRPQPGPPAGDAGGDPREGQEAATGMRWKKEEFFKCINP